MTNCKFGDSLPFVISILLAHSPGLGRLTAGEHFNFTNGLAGHEFNPGQGATTTVLCYHPLVADSSCGPRQYHPCPGGARENLPDLLVSALRVRAAAGIFAGRRARPDPGIF